MSYFLKLMRKFWSRFLRVAGCLTGERPVGVILPAVQTEGQIISNLFDPVKIEQNLSQ